MTATDPLNFAGLSTAADYAQRAVQLKRDGNEQQALAAATAALRLDPGHPMMWDFVGVLLLQRGLWHEASPYLKQAIDLAPTKADFRSHYAMALMERNELREASRQVHIALGNDPQCADAQFMMGEILCRAGYYDLAQPYYSKARQNPQRQKSATFAQAFSSFICGDLESGMALFASSGAAEDQLALPDWNGQPDQNLHLVLIGEYGFGDLLQFIRYVRLAQKRVKKITLSLPYPLVKLIHFNFPDMMIHAYHVPPEKLSSLPESISTQMPIDAMARCFYMNLPHLLTQPFDPLNHDVPYIRSRQEKAVEWGKKVDHIPTPRIGLVWSGNVLNQNNHNRSLPFASLSPLIDRAREHIVSMQYGDDDGLAKKAGLFDPSIEIKDFDDSAGIMSVLDLVISPCSAPTHLAGAMGIPVWTPLAFNADWRWLIGREDSIWYPSARLFRQQTPKDWDSIVVMLTQELDRLISGDRSVLTPMPWNKPHLRRHPLALTDIEI